MPLGLGVESRPSSPLSVWVFFFLELGNTISSLFGGGATPDAKENGTDSVQVRAAWSQGSTEAGVQGHQPQGVGWASQLPGRC